MTVEEILDMICSAERRAGEMILQAHGIIAENKTDARNIVTAYDRGVQDYLTDTFRRKMPDAHFFCEENDIHDNLSTGPAFIIDPIDGTLNFVAGFRHSCVSVAYSVDGTVLASAIYNPYADELFSAMKGKGAFLNGKAIHVHDHPLSGSVACVGTSPYNHELTEATFRMMRFMYDQALDIRREGAAALDLCSVAAGRAGVFVEERLSYWDYAAGALLVEEAGGKCFSAPGVPLPCDGSRSCVVAMGSGIELPDEIYC